MFFRGAARILADLGIVTPAGELDFSLAHSFLSDDRLRRSYLRGMFLGAGYVTLPSGGGSKTGYHLEFIFSCYEVAAEFSDYLAQISVFPTLTERKDHFIVYVKSSEEIKDFFALLSLPKSVLRITDCMVEREIRGAVNRQRNCDVGNVTKQVAASEKQIAAIGKIDAGDRTLRTAGRLADHRESEEGLPRGDARGTCRAPLRHQKLPEPPPAQAGGAGR